MSLSSALSRDRERATRACAVDRPRPESHTRNGSLCACQPDSGAAEAFAAVMKALSDITDRQMASCRSGWSASPNRRRRRAGHEADAKQRADSRNVRRRQYADCR